MVLVLICATVTHGFGVYFGSLYSEKVPQALIKKVVAITSIVIALWKLLD